VAVYVLAAFEKRTPKTALHDVRLARDRYRAVVKKRADDAKKNSVTITPSTGNVFRDLGFSAEESEHLLVRADLLI